MRHKKNGVYLYISINLKVLLKMQWIFVIFYTISSSLYTISSFVLGRSAIKMTLGPSQPPTPSCIYTSMYLEVIAVLH